MRKSKSKNNYQLFAGIVVLVIMLGVVGITAVGKAQQAKSDVEQLTDLANALGGNVEAFQTGLAYLGSQVQDIGSELLGATGTRFPNGISADNTSPNIGEVRGTTLTATATTTIQELTYGSRYSKALTTSAGSTTTAGLLISIQNTGAQKICDYAEIEFTTAPSGSEMVVSLATSTSATGVSLSGAGIIASTTVATSTPIIINSHDQVGGSTMDSFSWANGVYILGRWDNQDAFATSTDYSSAAGNVYIRCHTQ